jgi:hypothetical protein
MAECERSPTTTPANPKTLGFTHPSDPDKGLGLFQLLCLLQRFLCHDVYSTFDAAEGTTASVKSLPFTGCAIGMRGLVSSSFFAFFKGFSCYVVAPFLRCNWGDD